MINHYKYLIRFNVYMELHVYKPNQTYIALGFLDICESI